MFKLDVIVVYKTGLFFQLQVDDAIVVVASRESVVDASQKAVEPKGGVGKVACNRVGVVVAGRGGNPCRVVVAQGNFDFVTG